MKMHSDFLNLEIDPEELAAMVERFVGIRYRLIPLAVKCTYPVFRGERDGAEPVFVKIGTEDEWRKTTGLLKDIGGCGLFAAFLTERRIDYRGYALFVTEWRRAESVRPEDFSESQINGFVNGCRRLSEALQGARDYQRQSESPTAPDRLYGIVSDYVRRHPVAGRLLKNLVGLSAEARSYRGRRTAVMHGDFHSRNFGFSGDEMSAVFDFDRLTEGLACGDMMNALVERFSCLGLSAAARGRLKDVAARIVAVSPWSREEMAIMVNVGRLQFAARRIMKHPDSAWVAFDIRRRDRRIRELLDCGLA